MPLLVLTKKQCPAPWVQELSIAQRCGTVSHCTQLTAQGPRRCVPPCCCWAIQRHPGGEGVLQHFWRGMDTCVALTDEAVWPRSSNSLSSLL